MITINGNGLDRALWNATPTVRAPRASAHRAMPSRLDARQHRRNHAKESGLHGAHNRLSALSRPFVTPSDPV